MQETPHEDSARMGTFVSQPSSTRAELAVHGDEQLELFATSPAKSGDMYRTCSSASDSSDASTILRAANIGVSGFESHAPLQQRNDKQQLLLAQASEIAPSFFLFGDSLTFGNVDAGTTEIDGAPGNGAAENIFGKTFGGTDSESLFSSHGIDGSDHGFFSTPIGPDGQPPSGGVVGGEQQDSAVSWSTFCEDSGMPPTPFGEQPEQRECNSVPAATMRPTRRQQSGGVPAPQRGEAGGRFVKDYCGPGTVTHIDDTRAIVHSKSHGGVLVLPSSVFGYTNSGKITEILKVGDEVYYEARLDTKQKHSALPSFGGRFLSSSPRYVAFMCKPLAGNSFRSRGVIDNLQSGFAFIKSDIGTAFLPGVALKDNINEVHNLDLILRNNDEVEFTAVDQATKANCPLRAVSASLPQLAVALDHDDGCDELSLSNMITLPLAGEIAASTVLGVGIVTETRSTKFAFAWSKPIGCVYIAVECCQDGTHRDIRLYLGDGDRVFFRAVRQSPKNGCSWYAVEVYRISSRAVFKLDGLKQALLEYSKSKGRRSMWSPARPPMQNLAADAARKVAASTGGGTGSFTRRPSLGAAATFSFSGSRTPPPPPPPPPPSMSAVTTTQQSASPSQYVAFSTGYDGDSAKQLTLDSSPTTRGVPVIVASGGNKSPFSYGGSPPGLSRQSLSYGSGGGESAASRRSMSSSFSSYSTVSPASKVGCVGDNRPSLAKQLNGSPLGTFGVVSPTSGKGSATVYDAWKDELVQKVLNDSEITAILCKRYPDLVQRGFQCMFCEVEERKDVTKGGVGGGSV